MNKPGLAFLVLLLVAGCKTAPTTKTPSPTPAGQAAQVTQTQAVSHAAKAVEPPAAQAQTSATLKKAEKGSPHHRGRTKHASASHSRASAAKRRTAARNARARRARQIYGARRGAVAGRFPRF